MSLTPHQITLISQSFYKVEPISEKITEIFYKTLFAYEPTVKSLFKGDMQQQGRKLMVMLHTVVNSLNRLDNLVPVLQDLAKRHVDYGVKKTHYTPVGNALIHTLQIGLGDDFTPEVKAAWIAILDIIADTMKAEMDS
ncbi:globin family protein [Candidatus Enterovibrio escicola]|uniref:Putative bacterial hemoglobin n=4 Tax=Candidatus Enterovibrio escicola TaxID=1927127 RepID=A0A2A5SZ43_9GAMM|nr:globin family protein [Candidatus Enterovibrio escacola]PCS21193.1 putative bacterial hemoglobin [Candidatus Enterovibrio escacola]